MSLDRELEKRSGGVCEICASAENLGEYSVSPNGDGNIEKSIHACNTCIEQMNDADKIDPNHWRCLNDSMWSEVSAVKVLAFRMLNKLRSEGWPQDLLDMIYLDEDELSWAKLADYVDPSEEVVVHRDSNGAVLTAGDSVVLIKDLNVKGASFIAKRGEAVRNITLVHDNAEHIEGKVNGQRIVILTQYVKKTS